VGYVAERPTLYDWMTTREIGWFTGGFYGSGFYDRYLRLAADYQLPLARKIKHLSKGMRAKVSLALALAHEPEVLILDEPTSGLDTLVRREFLEGMVDLAAAGRTVFLSSHQIGEVERVADIVGILREGKLLLVERLDTLKDEIRELSITLADEAREPPPLSGAMLHQRRHHHQLQLLVRGVPDGELEGLRSDHRVQELGVRTPSLEEIFVAYLRLADASGSQPSGTPEVTAP
jgi:ABC-2 type transport system ATP-binding protein